MYPSEQGIIIVGYQGIGKSTLAYHNKRVIDLESSNFFVNGERSKDWHVV
jgi:ABC-type phosphate/phosphonate transport system ATPase subunit